MHAFLHSPAFRATTLRSKLYEAPAVCALAVDWQYPYLATFKLSPTPDLDVPCLPPDYPMLPVSTLANRLLDLADDTTTGSVEPVAGGANFVSGVSTKDVTMVDSADSDAASPDLDASVIDLETGRQAPQSCDERCEAQSSDDSDSEPADATSSPDATPGTKQDTDIPTLSTSDDTQTPSADSVDAYKPFAAFDSPSAGPLDAILEDEPSSASTPSPDTSTEDSEVSGQFDDAPDDASLPAMDTSTSALAACPSASTINTSVGPATPATPQKFRIRSRLSVIAVQSPTSFQSPTVASRRRSLDAAVLYGGALAGKERTARDGFRARGFVRAIPRWRP
ncbi:hypothetical protein BV25DRAFT_1820711 [Artomyces pyxidatus]|uniref:Uncharacterized protein n=1 Tax=Artomyces pyxidatus TaxID=48021 RepID=A0ACB8TDZ8_9AGAM|nr:hypothetical protein BV25DRAFT_1820711 [Artomyces pyxidatus]